MVDPREAALWVCKSKGTGIAQVPDLLLFRLGIKGTEFQNVCLAVRVVNRTRPSITWEEHLPEELSGLGELVKNCLNWVN